MGEVIGGQEDAREPAQGGDAERHLDCGSEPGLDMPSTPVGDGDGGRQCRRDDEVHRHGERGGGARCSQDGRAAPAERGGDDEPHDQGIAADEGHERQTPPGHERRRQHRGGEHEATGELELLGPIGASAEEVQAGIGGRVNELQRCHCADADGKKERVVVAHEGAQVAGRLEHDDGADHEGQLAGRIEEAVGEGIERCEGDQACRDDERVLARNGWLLGPHPSASTGPKALDQDVAPIADKNRLAYGSGIGAWCGELNSPRQCYDNSLVGLVQRAQRNVLVLRDDVVERPRACAGPSAGR